MSKQKFKITVNGVEETWKLGAKLAACLKAGDIICLCGDLGAGKTTFVKGVAKKLKINPDDVRSPTFVIMNIYDGKLPVYHFDLYRLDEITEIQAIGYDEFLYGDGVSFIEWSERFGSLHPEEFLKIEINHKTETSRQFIISAQGERYQKIIEKLVKI